MMLLAAQAFGADPVKRLYVFGDSYSDSGRGWVDSDGPTSVVYMAQRMGLVLVPSNAPDATGKSLNFASSGAVTGEHAGKPVEGGLMSLGMKNQVQEFLAMVDAKTLTFDPATTVFFLAGGLNDSRIQTEETVAHLKEEIESLHAAGARRFRLAILPEEIPAFTRVAKRLNPALRDISKTVHKEFPDTDIKTSEWGRFYDVVITHPSKYGFTNTTDKCAGRSIRNEDTTPCATPASYFYYHAGHPSTAASKVVGDMLYAEMMHK